VSITTVRRKKYNLLKESLQDDDKMLQTYYQSVTLLV
jgi:hypothetical protein